MSDVGHREENPGPLPNHDAEYGVCVHTSTRGLISALTRGYIFNVLCESSELSVVLCACNSLLSDVLRRGRMDGRIDTYTGFYRADCL